MSYISLDELEKKLLQDPDFKKDYDLIDPDYQAMAELYKQKNAGKISQRELSKKVLALEKHVDGLLYKNRWSPIKTFLKSIRGTFLKIKTAIF